MSENLLTIGGLIASAVAAIYVIRRILTGPRSSDYRTRNGQDAAQHITRLEEQPANRQPGHDHQLYLDCIAIYGDCEELDRLRDAINQARKEEL